MHEIVETMKLHIHTSEAQGMAFDQFTRRYATACDFVSQYVFDHGFILNSLVLQQILYQTIRKQFELKAQMTISVIKTVTARYKTVQEQLWQHPYRYPTIEGDKEVWKSIPRTLEWLQKPIRFSRPQADLVRGRDYNFLNRGKLLSLNTLEKRAQVSFDVPDYFYEKFLDGSWTFGAGKLVKLKGEWYFHISMTKKVLYEAEPEHPSHVVGIDRGLRFLASVYDEQGRSLFFSGQEAMRKRQAFADTRAELQSKGTKSAKRVLKRISGRENRWMSDVNHQISKTLVQTYGEDALFVLEDLTGVSFAEQNLNRGADGNRELRSWAFYQFEQFLKYKADDAGAMVIKVSPAYTSQRCPKCGRIHKQNRDHHNHEYICDACGYRSNDDRIGAMNLYTLGTMYVSGDTNPRFGVRKVN